MVFIEFCRLAGSYTSNKESDTAQKLIDGKYGNNCAIMQAYGKEHGESYFMTLIQC